MVRPFNKNRDRPILVVFQKQADHDLIHGKKMALKLTKDYSRIWINENISPMSKRKQSLIASFLKRPSSKG